MKKLLTGITLLLLSSLALVAASKNKNLKNLPKVLLIGDSISLSYTSHVIEALKGTAAVSRAKGNCQYTGFGLEKLDKWLGKTKWDVIHFNWGLWDIYGWRYSKDPKVDLSPGAYEKRLDQLLVRLKKTGSTLIWCTTTPVSPEAEKGMKK
ncbi:MAG: SGNH/GDSL hydrolase family protein [Lentisphaeraceae bacterium]|nr:SGNH/GDSL hydrolase family protein [Lentisphaeraceae bacterium]